MAKTGTITRIYNRDKPPFGLNLMLQGVDGYVAALDMKPDELAVGDVIEYEESSKRLGAKTVIASYLKKTGSAPVQQQQQQQSAPQGGGGYKGRGGGGGGGNYNRQGGGGGGGYQKDRLNENGVSGVDMNSAVSRAIEFTAMLLANGVLKLPAPGEKGHTESQRAKIVEFLEECVKERAKVFYSWSREGFKDKAESPAKADKSAPAARGPQKEADLDEEGSDLEDPFA